MTERPEPHREVDERLRLREGDEGRKPEQRAADARGIVLQVLLDQPEEVVGDALGVTRFEMELDGA